MRYEHTPRPQIEDHYHIRELIERQEKRSDDRKRHQDKVKDREENMKLIKDSKGIALTDFYCEKCEEDFKGVAVKQIEEDWNCKGHYIAFYKTQCFKGHWCIRQITDKFVDGFFIKSKAIVRDRGVYFNDTVQPGDTGYSLLYGKKNA